MPDSIYQIAYLNTFNALVIMPMCAFLIITERERKNVCALLCLCLFLHYWLLFKVKLDNCTLTKPSSVITLLVSLSLVFFYKYQPFIKKTDFKDRHNSWWC